MVGFATRHRYAHRFDWSKIRILRSWAVPLDACAISVSRAYVALATRREVLMFTAEGHKKESLGKRSSVTRKGEPKATDYIAARATITTKMMKLCRNI